MNVAKDVDECYKVGNPIKTDEYRLSITEDQIIDKPNLKLDTHTYPSRFIPKGLAEAF
jgi:hypothetical protein